MCRIDSKRTRLQANVLRSVSRVKANGKLDRETEEDVAETPINPALWPWTQTGVCLCSHVHGALLVYCVRPYLRVHVRYSLMLVIPGATCINTLPS